jgi:putative holliday junction resolvase
MVAAAALPAFPNPPGGTMNGRILAVDPGEKRIGIAISDPTALIARPLLVLKHVSRAIDAASIAQLAAEHQAVQIVIGEALDEEGQLTPQARHAARLADAIREQSDLPVVLWDESGSTQNARAVRIEMGAPRKKRQGHLDEVAAALILQSYLDSIHRDGTG